MNSLEQLRECQSVMDSDWSATALPALVAAIDQALSVAPPDGLPDVISEQGQAYLEASSRCQNAAPELDDVARNKLPAAWQGDVAQIAGHWISSVSARVRLTSRVLSTAGKALVAWSEDLQTAQRHDQSGRAALRSAKRSLLWTGAIQAGSGAAAGAGQAPSDPDVLKAALAEARSGVERMVRAATLAKDSGEGTTTVLGQLTGDARAKSGNGPEKLDSLAMVRKAASDGGGDILTTAALSRARHLLKGMSAAGRAKFSALLADARSPQEAAFLVQALAAGHSLSQIEKFDAVIHPHGDDPAWLSQHLSPNLTNDSYDGHRQIGKGWAIYSQREVGDCVAASTVVALAKLDPLFMLKLTTGGHPGVAGTDSPQHFEQRLQHAYIQQYQEGQRADGDRSIYPHTDKGLYPKGETVVTNSDLGHATGQQYHYVQVHSGSQNQAVLPKIEQAVHSGVPVPVDVINPSTGSAHQLMVIGEHGGQLQIYNPWGSTWWVNTHQFVSNQLGFITKPDNIRQVYGMELPS